MLLNYPKNKFLVVTAFESTKRVKIHCHLLILLIHKTLNLVSAGALVYCCHWPRQGGGKGMKLRGRQ